MLMSNSRQASEEVAKQLKIVKEMLIGTGDSEPQMEQVVAQLAQEMYMSNLLLMLIQNLSKIDFEVNCY